jgi:hypothetical protein
MARRLLAAAIVAVALGIVPTAAGRQSPILRSARVVRHHLVLVLSVTDVRPTALTVAKRRAVSADGELLQRNVLVQEAIRLPVSETGVVRWRSGKRLRRGVYFVQVTAVETGGVTDCPRFSPDCNVRRSNVRRIVVRAAR